MDKVTAEQVAEVAGLLAMVAGVFSPANAASIALLASAAGRLNMMIAAIRDQSEANQKAVWDSSVADFKDAMSGWESSVKKK